MNRGALVAVGVLGLLAAGAAVVPYWFGIRAEETYNAQLKQATDQGKLSVSQSSFERGWLSSTAETTVSVPGAPVGITMLHKIHHGPFPIADGIDLNPVLARVNSQISLSIPEIKSLPQITVESRVQLSGETDSRITVPAYKHAGADGGGVEWQGLNGTGWLSADAKRVKLDLNAPLLKVSGAQGGFTANGFTVALDQTESPSGLDTGSANLGINKISIDAATGSSTVDGLRLATSTSEAGGNVTSSVNLQIRAVGDSETRYGPGQMTMQIRKLDAQALVKYQNELRAMQKQKIPPEQMSGMMLGKLIALAGSLAKKAPELEVSKLSLKIEDGEVSGKAKFVLDGSQLDVTENPALLMMAFSGEGELSFDEPVLKALSEREIVRQIEALKSGGRLSKADIDKLTPQRVSEITAVALPGQMSKLVARLNLVPDGERYKITGAIKQGRFLVNGQPFQPGGP
ncbi:MAG TPA: YdgA family protein [Acidiferrobacterales bacterium]